MPPYIPIPVPFGIRGFEGTQFSEQHSNDVEKNEKVDLER